MKLGVKETPLTFMVIGIAGSFIAYSTGVLNLNETLLLVIAISTTVMSVIQYFNMEVNR